MSKDLEKFFNLITEAKQKRSEPNNDTEKLLTKSQFHIKVKATELKDFFNAFEEEKNKLLEQKKKDQDKLEELEKILFSKLPSPRKTIKKETKPIVQNLSGPKKSEPEETNLESIREAVMQANQALLIKEDEPEDLVNQSASELTAPTIGNEEKPTDIEISTEDVIKELSKISTNTGVILNKDIDSVEELKKEFIHFKKLVTQQLESLGGGGGAASEDVDLSEVSQDIIPDTNNLRNLGSASKRWKKAFLASQTIDIGGAEISSDGTGAISIAATGATLPEGSKAGSNQLAVTGTGGRTGGIVIQKVPFYTRAGGLSTKNADFEFNATIDTARPFTDKQTYKLANGTTLAETDELTLFQL